MDTKSERRMDLDWMRVIAILVVFVFHSFRFFSLERWHVNNPVTYPQVDIGLEFLGFFMMPFIFTVSGASLFFALGKGRGLGGAGKFIKDKVLRLLVPLVVNIFSFSFLQVYLERITHAEFSGSMIDFIPRYFEGIYGLDSGGNFAIVGMHLWYLAVLFLFSIVIFPLFVFLKSRIGAAGLRKFTDLVAFPGGIYVLALVVVLLWKLIDPESILGFDKFNWNLGVYLSYFVVGFIVISSERLQRSIKNLRWVSLALAVAASAWWVSSGEHTDLVSWTWILTFLGFGFRYLNRDVPFIRYAGEAVLPFYILHQTVLLGVGYFVVQLAIPDGLKWAAIAVLSLGIIMGSYEYLVRRINLLRVLFGMKPVRQSRQPAPLPAPVVTEKA